MANSKSGASRAVLFRSPSPWLMAVLMLLIALAGNSLYRNKTSDLQHHPDELIPIRVLQTMHTHGDLNTDWARADLPEYFQVCRYNFSGYILFSYLAVRATAPNSFKDDAALLSNLQRLSRLAAVVTLCIVFWILARNLGVLYGLGGAAAVLFVPQLYQDGHYARPEALGTLGFTACFALACVRPGSRWQRRWIAAAIAVCAGFLFSIKVTYVTAAAFMLPALLAEAGEAAGKQRMAEVLFSGLVLTVLFMLGFCIGAPGAIADPAGFLEGIEALRRQYSGLHPPHSAAEGSGMRGQVSMLAGYYLATLGAPLLTFHFLGYPSQVLASAKLPYAIAAGVTLTLFLTQSVFFERNLSLLLPAYIVIGLVGISAVVNLLVARRTDAWRSVLKPLLAVATIGACLTTPYQTYRDLARVFSRKELAALSAQDDRRIEDALSRTGREMSAIAYGDVVAGNYPAVGAGCRLYLMTSYGDHWSNSYITRLPPTLRVIETMPSLFEGIPTSTLHTYHDATRYLIASGECTHVATPAQDHAAAQSPH